MELGFMEMVVIALAIVVLFGPDKLPSIARDLGSGVRKMRGAVEDIKSEILKEADNPVSEIKKEIEKVKQAARDFDPMAENAVKKSTLESPVRDKEEAVGSTPTIAPSEDENYQGPVRR